MRRGTAEPKDVFIDMPTKVFSEEVEETLEENPTKRPLTDDNVKVIILDMGI